MDQARILIIGCGRLGYRVATQLSAQGCQLAIARRSSTAALEALPNALTYQLDITDIASLSKLADQNWQAVIVAVTADQFTETAYRRVYIEGLANLLSVLGRPGGNTAAKIFFVSSTSVYAQNDGSWVDESSATEPESFSGRTMLEAEQLLLRSHFCTSSIRLAGLYGAGEGRLLQRAARGERCATPHYSNRIHIDDAASLVCHLVRGSLQGDAVEKCYLGVDDEPALLGDVMTWLALQQGVEASDLRDVPAPVRGGSKRCSNRRIKAKGYKFIYPDFRAGYAAMMAGCKAEGH